MPHVLAASLVGTSLGQRLIAECNTIYIKRREQSGKWDDLLKTCDDLMDIEHGDITAGNIADKHLPLT